MLRKSKAGGHRNGFTLMEVILVLVIVVIISAVSLPYFAGSYKGTKLRTASRTMNRMAKYARSMAIMRETTMTIVLNPETMEIFLGGPLQTSTNAADGELDQAVLKRLGYIEDDTTASGKTGIEREVFRFLPDSLSVKSFEKDRIDADGVFDDLHLIRYYPNGQCDWFKMELVDQSGLGVVLENDPVSGKIMSEFEQ